MQSYPRSSQAFLRAQRYLAGGVSSMMRASAKPVPLFFRSACGATLTDYDGRKYLDYSLAWGPLILGHSHPAIVRAIRKQLDQFLLLGAQHELEYAVARRICGMVPSAQLVAFSNTGTEAVQLALRLARTFTGRPKFIKFEGHYHGWADSVLLGYHPAAASQPGKPVPASEGQSRSVYKDVIVLPWNDPEALSATLDAHGDEIAAIITEPFLCNSSCLLPVPGYMEHMRRLCNRYHCVLVFDEVITGFRVATGGAQSLLRVMPDLTVLGKALGAGLPVSAVCGRRRIMNLIPQRRTVHAGTFNGNPLSLAAADAVLRVLAAGQGSALRRVRRCGERLQKGIDCLARQMKIPCLINGVGSVFHLSFTSRLLMRNYRDTLDCDLNMRDCFLQAMLENGVYLIPDGRWYVSAAHTEAQIDQTLQAVEKSFARLADMHG